MAVKKEPTKPLDAVRHDFVRSLEAVVNEAIMFLTAVETVIHHDTNLKPHVKKTLEDRAAAFRKTLFEPLEL